MIIKNSTRVLILGVLGLLLQPAVVLAQDWIYTTVPGDNIWDISEKHLDTVLRYNKIKTINGVKAPKRMQPGTKLRIPMKWVRSNPTSAEIMEVRGSGELIRNNGDIEKALSPGTKINLGDQLKTAADSSIAIKFADKSVLTLHEDSLIRFDHLSAHGTTGMVDTRMKLIKGRMDTRVTPASGPGSRFEIKTPSAISAVRGTEYRAAILNAENTSNIEVLKGKVAVSGAKKKKLIKAGFGTQVAQGKAPIAARKLLPPPVLKPLPERIRRINWMIQWDAIEGAEKYRIEVANEAKFNTLIWHEFSAYTRAAFPNLVDGHYFVRIRGVDKLALEGKSVVKEIVLDAHPQPPVQLKPDEDHVFRGKSPELQWTSSADAAKYRLEIASDKDFKQVLLDSSEIMKNSYDTAKLSAVGHYYWRLTSIAPDGEVGPVGRLRGYEIKPMPKKVSAELQAADDGQLVATWEKGTRNQTYQIQMAYDEQFIEQEFDKKTNEAKISFEPVSGMVRYLRIRSIEEDGYQGPWGTTQRVDPLPDDTLWWVPAIGLLGIFLL
ncbi:FecR domain-containing protein [sulfur-oxidizing endosymbiont of Gigantopelta aegis]|uniref:FecR domain-containing protein n=1 Tax=sulfur-oxidizing endosymbiont of Gigantopelta aegis TaxID=2794934 RepID=UPI0018DE4D10|nr:FecR domain-containing protein [sulfur-oxidizing endosymbiont of Gigantopelta aegis]